MTPARLRVVVSWVLLTGVSISAALIAIGFAASFLVGWQGSLMGGPHGGNAPITDFGGLLDGLASLRPQAIAQLGLIALVATPIVRVITSLVAFVIEGDRMYIAITALVLAILLLSALFIR
jgi:Predicted membrane protein